MRSHILGRIEIDQECLGEGLGYLSSAPTAEEGYGGLGNGLWNNVPLHNASGGSDDKLYRDLHGAPAQSTEHFEHVPYLNETITTVSSVERLQGARTRNLKIVLPHRDLVEIDQYFRTRSVLEDSPSAFHSDDDTVSHKRADEIRVPDPTAVHLAEFTRQSLCVGLAFEGALGEKEAFADATVYTPNLNPDIHVHMPFATVRAQELGERFSLTSWYGSGERGPGEQ